MNRPKKILPILILELRKTEHPTDDSSDENQTTLKGISTKLRREIDENSKIKKKVQL